MLYVHVAEVHARELPDPIQKVAMGETDPDRRILKMLVRAAATWQQRRPNRTKVKS